MKELDRLFPYIKRHKTQFILGFIFVTISNFGSTYMPRIVGGAVDKISSGNFLMNDIYSDIGTILVLVFISGFFMVLTRRTIIYASREIEYELRKDLLEKVQNYPMSFYHNHSTGSLMAHTTNDIPAAREFIGPAIMYSANTLTTFVFALYFMLSLNPKITLIGLLPLPLIAYGTYLIGKKIHIAFKDVQEQFGELTTQAQESISGIRVIRAYVRDLYESSIFNQISRSYLQKNLKLAKIEAIMMPLLMILIGLSQVSVLAYGGFMVINGTATIGDLTQFFIYLNLLIWPVAAIGWVTNLIQRAAASAGRLDKLMNYEAENIKNETNEPKDIYGNIIFKNVCLKYSEDSQEILSNLNFEITKGMTIGIIGSVGSGKSSLVNMLTGLFLNTSGEILFNGHNLKDISLNQLRKNIGIVPQDSFLFSASIKDNIKFGNPDANDEDIIEASRKSQLHNEVLTFESAYDTLLGERGVTLSGGQKQRVAIARALLKEPDILILDDALSAVDTQTEELLLAELRTFMRDRTTIIISHRISSLSHSDKIIVLDNGKIVEKGTHSELIELPGIYAQIYQRQKLEQELEVIN